MAITAEVLSHFSVESTAYVQNLVEYFAPSKPKQDSKLLDLKSLPSSRFAGVLVLLYEAKGMIRALLTTRGKNLRMHGGETSFPGGKMEDSDEDIIETAYREANEEVSLPLDSPHIHTLGILDPHKFYNLVVTPVVALLTDNSVLEMLRPCHGEVDHIFSHPLEAMLQPELAASLEPQLTSPSSEYWPYDVKYHHFKDYVVQSLGNTGYRWHLFQSSASPITGLTADILIHVAEVVYRQEPNYERWAPTQLRTYEDIVKASKS